MPPENHKLFATDRFRFEHMLEAARDAVTLIEGHTREDLDSIMPLRRAVIQCVMVIGEAAARLSDSGREFLPNLP